MFNDKIEKNTNYKKTKKIELTRQTHNTSY
jgi:hypothetical protein